MKMKNGKINLSLMLFASAIAGATFIYSCTKDTDPMNPSSPTNSPVVMNAPPYTPCTNVANADNPYDQAGFIHNDALQYMMAHKPQWSCGDHAQWIQTCVDLTATYACDNGYGPADNCYSIATGELNNVINLCESMTAEQIIANTGSAQLQDYIGQLHNEVRSYTDSTQIDTLLTSIKQLESGAMGSTLNPDEKRTFLEAASIARYSACYWFQEHQKSVTDWHCPTNPIPAGKFNWGRFGLIVFADVCGGLAGSWGGPIGSTVGAALVSGAFAAE
jgi:hypothetical protein